MNTYESLLKDIEKASEEGVTIEHAERIAAKSLFVMNSLSERLTLAETDRRMRKQGLKAVRSAVRQEEVKKFDKKPTEGHLEDVVNMNSLVQGEETAFDSAEVNTDEITRHYNIAKEAHLYFRGVAKGAFGG